MEINPEIENELAAIPQEELMTENQAQEEETTKPKMMVLRTENLIKKYRTRTVVDHVSINVKQGEIVGLLGPNGAGKTTTFYMTVGLVIPNAGKIYLDNQEITNYILRRTAYPCYKFT